MTYHNYILLYLFFIFICCLCLEIASFIPAGRHGHSSVLVGNKIYFFGGTDNGKFSNEVFYLDVSLPFKTSSPPWSDPVNGGMPIKSSWGTVSLSDNNNEQNIYLFGGATLDITTNKDSYQSLVYKLNLKSGQWEIPPTKGKVPERRREIKAVNDNSGKIYIFGGNNLVSLPGKYFNDMIIFNAVDLSWSISLLSNAPLQQASYSATLLSNGVIAYIGGYGPVNNVLSFVDISQISLYDTNTLTWTVKTTTNLTGQIDSRRGHTAVLAANDKIIIHGGSKFENFQATPDIAVLNTETFEWTIPLVSSNIGAVPSLTYHTANLVGNHMIVAFGNITQEVAYPLEVNSKIYLLDIRNYTWVDTFDSIVKPAPSSNSSTTISPTTSSNTSTTSAKTTNTSENPDVNDQLTTMKVVIGTISGIVGAAILVTIVIFGYKYQRIKRGKQDEIMRIHGNNT